MALSAPSPRTEVLGSAPACSITGRMSPWSRSIQYRTGKSRESPSRGSVLTYPSRVKLSPTYVHLSGTPPCPTSDSDRHELVANFVLSHSPGTTQMHILLRALRRLLCPAWLPRQNVSASLDRTLLISSSIPALVVAMSVGRQPLSIRKAFWSPARQG